MFRIPAQLDRSAAQKPGPTVSASREGEFTAFPGPKYMDSRVFPGIDVVFSEYFSSAEEIGATATSWCERTSCLSITSGGSCCCGDEKELYGRAIIEQPQDAPQSDDENGLMVHLDLAALEPLGYAIMTGFRHPHEVYSATFVQI